MKANESTKDVDLDKPAKRRKTSEGKKAKGKKVSILYVTEPYSPGSTPDKECVTPAPVDAALLASPLIPTHGIQQDSAASDLMKQVLEKVEHCKWCCNELRALLVNSLQQCKCC